MNDLMSLWQIEDELTALVDSIDVCPEHLKEELEQRIAHYVGAEVEKVDRIAAALSSLDNMAANARAEIERLRERQQSAEKAARWLESYVLRILRKRDGQPLKGHSITFIARRSESLWGNRGVVKKKREETSVEKKYWIALNGPACVISRTPWLQPVTIPVAQQYFGFPTLKEAERAQDICLHQPDAEVRRFLESLSPDVKSGRIRVIQPPYPQPPTKGTTWWLESVDARTIAPRLIEPRN